MVKAPQQNQKTANSHGGGGSHTNSKFKSWRRGKSTRAKNAGKPSGSVKQQLRGLERLLQRKQQQQQQQAQNGDEKMEASAEITAAAEQGIHDKMKVLQQQMDARSASEKERNNTTKSHKMRFIERQRTTRLYKHLSTQLADAIKRQNCNDDTVAALEQELYKLALDQVYIAHFPLDQTSYLSLFQNSATTTASIRSSETTQQQQQRRRPVGNTNRLLYKMAHCRKLVLQRLMASTTPASQASEKEAGRSDNETPNDDDNDDTNFRDIAHGSGYPTKESTATRHARRMEHVSWIHTSQYERIQSVATWTTDLERVTFVTDAATTTTAIARNRTTPAGIATTTTKIAKQDDSRFSSEPSALHSQILEQQEQIDQELSNDDDDDEDDDDDSNDDDGEEEIAENVRRQDRRLNEDDYETDALTIKGNSIRQTQTLVKRDIHDSDDEEEEDDDDNVMDSKRTLNILKGNGMGTVDDDDNHDDAKEKLDTTSALRNLAAKKTANFSKAGPNGDEDDFLVDASEGSGDDTKNVNVFANAKRDSRPSNSLSGDKSWGWEMQRQLPGQFRKRTKRR